MRILLVFCLFCSATSAARYRVDFSIDATLEWNVPSPASRLEIPATWDFEVYYDTDKRRYDLFTMLDGDGVHATSVHERAGLGVDDAGPLEGYVHHPLLSEAGLDFKVHPNDFRIDREPDSYFRLRPEHDGHTAFSMGSAGPYSTTFRYEPSDLALASPIPDGDVDGNGVVNFADFLILSANFARHGSSVTYKDGDFNYDNRIDFDDFLILSGNFGTGAVQVVAVPEPMSAVSLLVGLGALRIRRRGRNRVSREHLISGHRHRNGTALSDACPCELW